jgi:release factor glutamine methyltransferase
VEDDDALIFYKKIAAWKKNLSVNRQLFFEINQYLGRNMSGCLKSLKFKSIGLRKIFIAMIG